MCEEDAAAIDAAIAETRGTDSAANPQSLFNTLTVSTQNLTKSLSGPGGLLGVMKQRCKMSRPFRRKYQPLIASLDDTLKRLSQTGAADWAKQRLVFAYRSAWLPHDPDAIQFGGTETRASLDALAGKMLTAFLASPAASVQGRVLGVEDEIRGMLVDGVPDLFGRVDLLTEDSDSLVVTDIKTSRGKWSPEQVEDSGEQLLLYSHLVSEISPGKKLKTRFLIVTKTKETVIEEHVREVEPAAVKRTLAGVERVWRAIESGVFYPAPSVMSCSSCGYRAVCRAWMG
jgi:putative RecB family exonuclease